MRGATVTGVRRPLAALSVLLALGACTRESPSLAGDRALREGRYEEAARLYEQGADRARSASERQAMHVKAGDVLDLYLEKHAEAAHEYRQAVQADPRTDTAFEARIKIGHLLEEVYGDPRKAIEEYALALSNHPKAPQIDEVRFRMAKAYFGMKEYDQARVEFQRLLEDQPHSPRAAEAAYDIADTWFVEEKFEQAEKAYRALLSEYGDSDFEGPAWFGLARCLEETGHLTDALETYEKALEKYENREVVALRIERLKSRREQLRPQEAGNFGLPANVEP